MSSFFSQPDVQVEVTMELDDKTYDVERFQIGIGQSVDFKGQPQCETRGGQFIVTLTQAIEDSIYEWGRKPGEKKTGVINFRTQSTGKVLSIKFTDAYCISLNRKVNAFSGTETRMVIAPRVIKMNKYDHINWE